MGGKAHKVFEREVTLSYLYYHPFLHCRTSASCERSAESFSRKGVWVRTYASTMRRSGQLSGVCSACVKRRSGGWHGTCPRGKHARKRSVLFT